MTKKTNISLLKSLIPSAPQQNRSKIAEVIKLYASGKVINYRTIFNCVDALASKNKNTMKSGRPDRLFNALMDKHSPRRPAPLVVAEPPEDKVEDPVFNIRRGNYDKAQTHTRVGIDHGENVLKCFA